MLPSMVVLGFAFLAGRATSRRSTWTLLRERLVPLAVAAGVAVLATSVLLAGRDRRGALYAEELWEREVSFAGDASLVLQLGRATEKLGTHLASFGLFGERVYDGRAGPDPVTMAAWAVIAATIVLGIRHASRRASLVGSFAALLVMALVIASLGESRHGHHFVLVFPFLLLSLAIALCFLHARRPRLAIGLVLALTATQLVTWVEVVRQRPASHDDWSKVAVLRKLNDERLASDYVYVVLDWGMYYLLALYGPRNETLVYLDPLRSDASFRQLEPLRELAARKQMRLAFIHQRPSASDLRRLAREVGPLERVPVPGAPRAVWQVRAQPRSRPPGEAASRVAEWSEP
ncbi:MAG: hypothetical protein FJ144_06740 [Deltaproteobacteria bacterium]|nr:hypothetical protein [Deltaproteobacteria bacterium]